MTRAASGIVLAGGRSERFGSDKLRATFEGQSLLAHAIEAVAAAASEVVVVFAPHRESPALPPDVRSVRDPRPDGGPLVGLLAGLEAAAHPLALVVGADMPSLQPGVLRLLLEQVESGAAAAILEGGRRRQSLPCAIDRAVGRTAARATLASGRTGLRDLLDALEATTIPAAAWRALDPDGRTLVDVDRPADLERLSRRGRPTFGAR